MRNSICKIPVIVIYHINIFIGDTLQLTPAGWQDSVAHQ